MKNFSTVVCIKHFDPQFIVTQDRFPVKDSEDIIFPRKIPKLIPNAYPSIFDNQPSYCSSEIPRTRKGPSRRRIELEDRDERMFESWMKGDDINNFEDFKEKLVEKVITPFTVFNKDSYVLFVNVCDEQFCYIPSISVSFKISFNLDVNIFRNVVSLQTDEYQWLLGDGLKCDKWTKFDNLVSILASEKPAPVCLKTKLKLFSDFLRSSDFEDVCDSEQQNKMDFLIEQCMLLEMKKITYHSYWYGQQLYSFLFLVHTVYYETQIV